MTVQTSDWNCGLLYTLNHKWGAFKDARVRRALNLAVDRWKAEKTLSQIAIVKTAGGIVFPSHPLAATKEELQTLEGFWPDIEKSRALARELLAEADAKDLSFTLNNREVDQPYRIIGTWLIGALVTLPATACGKAEAAPPPSPQEAGARPGVLIVHEWWGLTDYLRQRARQLALRPLDREHP